MFSCYCMSMNMESPNLQIAVTTPEARDSSEILSRPQAVLLDIDGTACANTAGAQPTEAVCAAIEEARAEDLHVGVMTGRPLFQAREIFGTLSGPSVLHGGALIADLSTGEIIRSFPLDPSCLETVNEAAGLFGITTDIEVISAEGYVPLQQKDQLPGDPLEMYITALDENVADALIRHLTDSLEVAAHKLISYTEGKIDISVTHPLATKDGSLFEVASLLGISVSDIIGVGDGYNDLAWLKHCGLSVAMGNAVAELKQQTNYTAPSVDDDGVAHVIRRFCLVR